MAKMGERSSSFGDRAVAMRAPLPIQRQKTDSELTWRESLAGASPEVARLPRPRPPAKLLLNVTLERSLGAVHVVMSPEMKVGDLVEAAVRLYVKEGRRPVLATADPERFNLHYSQFSLESLNRNEKLANLGSRNFFMCQNKDMTPAMKRTSSLTNCSNEVAKASKINVPWLRFMDFLM